MGVRQLFLEQAMIPNIILEQRLLDQEQVQVVKRLQNVGRLQAISGVGIHLELDLRISLRTASASLNRAPA